MEECQAIMRERTSPPPNGTNGVPAATDRSFVLNTELSQKMMVADFIEQLKEAEAPAASKFRARRLSSAHTYEKGPLVKMASADKSASEAVIYSST